MAKKQIKNTKARKTAVKSVKPQTLRLAGAGAFSLAGKRVGEVLGKLYVESKQLQDKTRKLTNEIVADLRSQLTGILVPVTARIEQDAIKLGTSVERGFGEVLSRLGIASKQEITVLTQRVSALSRQLKAAK